MQNILFAPTPATPARKTQREIEAERREHATVICLRRQAVEAWAALLGLEARTEHGDCPDMCALEISQYLGYILPNIFAHGGGMDDIVMEMEELEAQARRRHAERMV